MRIAISFPRSQFFPSDFHFRRLILFIIANHSVTVEGNPTGDDPKDPVAMLGYHLRTNFKLSLNEKLLKSDNFKESRDLRLWRYGTTDNLSSMIRRRALAAGYKERNIFSSHSMRAGNSFLIVYRSLILFHSPHLCFTTSLLLTPLTGSSSSHLNSLRHINSIYLTYPRFPRVSN